MASENASIPVDELTKPGRLDVVRNRSLLTLMLGHATVDMYSGVIPLLYPLLTDEFDLNLKTVGLVSLCYSGMASLTQPVFGWVTDRYGSRWIGLALMWTALTFALLGLAPSFTALLLLAALAGIGSGMYHPMGAVTAAAVIPDKQRNVAMSIYVTGGTLGVAIGPLIGVAVFALFGLHGTLAMVIPGATIAIFLVTQMKSVASRLKKRAESAKEDAPPIPLKPMSVVIALMMLRSWVLFGISAFIPLWYDEMGYSRLYYAALSTTILLCSAIGAVGVGSIADRHGRRKLLVFASVASVPAILLFAQFPGIPAFFTAAMIGLLAASTGPLLLVMAQQLMSGRPGMASGLILGLGFIMGAVGVPMMGAVADEWGIQNAMRLWAVIAALTIVVSMMLPTDVEVRRLSERPPVGREPNVQSHVSSAEA
ncbi:MAG: MFS transporter [Thermomicrobiales bacterium]|nr:MFS transporter [Thermomicrobiales bacterium]MCO5221805.1 MFS transporter [Thermomicrobiales bacterium]